MEHSATNFERTYANIKRHFDFLFKKGFHIVAFGFNSRDEGDWQITLHKGDHLIRLYSRWGRIRLELTTLGLYEKNILFDINDLAATIAGSEAYLHDEGNTPEQEHLQCLQIARCLKKNLKRFLDQIKLGEKFVNRHWAGSEIVENNEWWSEDHHSLSIPAN